MSLIPRPLILFILGTLLLAAPAFAASAAGDTLRVCAAKDDAPYSTADHSGFENKIAEVIAAHAGLELELVMFDRPAIYLVRDGINAGRCDLIMGVDEDNEQLLTSRPYYRSAYAFVARADRNFVGDTWQDADQEGFNTFAYRYYTPAETILKYTGRYEYNLVYQASLTDFRDRRNQYTQVSPQRVVSEVANAHADLAIIFAAEAGRYVRDSRVPLKMTLIRNAIERKDGVVIPLQYSESIGITKDKPELLAVVERALSQGWTEIQAILDAEQFPRLPLAPGGEPQGGNGT